MINRILIGEDNFVAQRLLFTMLESNCNNMVMASTSDEVLHALKNHEFDLLLLDYNLDRNADYIISEIGKLKLKNELPVYILSAESEEDVRKNLRGKKFDGYIAKSATREELERVILSVAKQPVALPSIETGSKEFDLSNLEKLLGSDPQKLMRVVRIFIEEATSHLAQMEALIVSEEYHELKRVVHRARASYGYLGLKVIEKQLTDWEEAISKRSETANHAALFEKIKENAHPIIFELRKNYENSLHVAQSQQRDRDKPLSGKKILVVDERSSFNSFLTLQGIEVVTASDIPDAIAFTRFLLPDLIFMSIDTPLLNGVDAITEIRKAEVKTPIVAIVNSTRSAQSAIAQEAGAAEFLPRSVSPELLLEFLKQHLHTTRI